MTLSDYTKQVHAGATVKLRLSNGDVLVGTAGMIWSGTGGMPIIRFKDGSICRVTEQLAPCVEVEVS